jgi:Arc/MetJ-type ribon-helix-helix transcriptional regulator
MSRQIAVRLPDDVVEFVDRRVAERAATSRAAVVAQALERERRRLIAARDAAILAAAGEDADMDGLARYAAETPLRDLG